VRADTFGYLQRSFPGIVSEVDAREARAVGVKAVQCAAGRDTDGSIAIRRKPGKAYRVYFERVALAEVARTTRCLPAGFINAAGNNVTQAFLNYVRPIVGPLPEIGRLKGYKVPRIG
jgi:6-phosphofructokinase 1